MRTLIALLVLLTLAAPAARADEPDVAAGIYSDGLLVGFDPATRMVTGYYSSETGRGQFRCIFFLKGRLTGSGADIATYFPETSVDDLINGKLLVESRTNILVQLPTEHGGCWNVEHFADKDLPANLTLTEAHAWTSVAVISRARAYFFKTPGAARSRTYAVKGDGVGVLAARPGWLKIELVGGDVTSTGWIHQSDVYPAR